MKPSEIKQILSAPLLSVQPATQLQKRVFPDKKEGQFYVFTLTSGQSFVGHVPEKEKEYTFRATYSQTYSSPLPQLWEIRWSRINSVGDLNYHTECQFLGEMRPTEQKAYLKALEPKRKDDTGPLTKIAFKYYHYHPMLERATDLQKALQNCREAQRLLSACKTKMKSLLISKNNINKTQQTKGETQNVRN